MLYTLTILLLTGFTANINTLLSTNKEHVEVQAVKVSGSESKYTFSVTLKSPDKGCSQYADWWEVISADGENLIYRRILAHSHVNEQPFTRSGGPVKISGNEKVIIRAHMNNLGYGNQAMIGSVKDGFKVVELESDFGNELEKYKPLPTGCAF